MNMKSSLLTLGVLAAFAGRPGLAWTQEEQNGGADADAIEQQLDDADAVADLQDDPGPLPPLPTDEYICRSKDLRGFVFRARGHLPVRVQNRAQRKCLAHSLACKKLGCEKR